MYKCTRNSTFNIREKFIKELDHLKAYDPPPPQIEFCKTICKSLFESSIEKHYTEEIFQQHPPPPLSFYWYMYMYVSCINGRFTLSSDQITENPTVNSAKSYFVFCV